MENILQQLIDLLKNIAPEVWQALILQVSIQAQQYLIWAIVIDVFAVLAIVFGAWLMIDDTEAVVLVIFGVFLALVSVGFWVARYGRLANPDFYAIQMLLSQLPK